MSMCEFHCYIHYQLALIFYSLSPSCNFYLNVHLGYKPVIPGLSTENMTNVKMVKIIKLALQYIVLLLVPPGIEFFLVEKIKASCPSCCHQYKKKEKIKDFFYTRRSIGHMHLAPIHL